ncbi:hypothetical protein GCM10020295_12300 [Streptomyces cinereospinus]
MPRWPFGSGSARSVVCPAKSRHTWSSPARPITAVTAPHARSAHSGQPWLTYRSAGQRRLGRRQAAHLGGEDGGRHVGGERRDGVRVAEPEQQRAPVDDEVHEVPAHGAGTGLRTPPARIAGAGPKVAHAAGIR